MSNEADTGINIFLWVMTANLCKKFHKNEAMDTKITKYYGFHCMEKLLFNE